MQHLSENGGIDSLYIRPDAAQRVFFQTDEGMALAAELGITPEILAESIALDTDIAVPMDLAMVHLLNNEQVYSELQPDMRAAPDIMTPREAETYEASEDGAPSQMDKEGSDFIDSIFAGLDEELAANERREAMAAPYVQQLVGSGYSEKQSQRLMEIFVANAERMASMFNQTPEEYISQRFAGFQLALPGMANLTEADIEFRARRQLMRAPMRERDPLLAEIWGRLDPASLTAYDPQAARELTRTLGLGLFRGKAKGGLALDVVADGLVRQGLMPEGTTADDVLALLKDRQGKRLYQIDSDVDPGMLVQVVRGESRFSGQNPQVLRKKFPVEVRKAVLAAFQQGVVNEDTGLAIGMSGRDFSKHLQTEGSADALAHLDAVAILPELMRTAKRIETHSDKDAGSSTKLDSVRRFISAFNNGTGDYAVMLTVKEHAPGQYVLDEENPVRLYHHRVEKQLAPASSTESGVEPLSSPTSSSTNGYTIRQLLEGVKDSAGEVYFHDGTDSARGYIDFTNPEAVIVLFKGKKNLSTVIHEGGHFFLENLCEAAQLETAPDWVAESWQSVQQEYGFDGFVIPREAHERFARDFEAYARDGKAPSSRLQSAFQQFSNWLTRLYRSVRALVGADEISPEIRKVFDRLLATEEEIEAAQREGTSSVSLDSLEAQGLTVTPDIRNRYARAVTEAHNKAAAAVAARRLVEQRARLARRILFR